MSNISESFEQKAQAEPESSPHSTPPIQSSKDDHIITLSEAVSVDKLEANVPYVMLDGFGRALAVNGLDFNATTWAYVGQYASHINDVHPISFSQNPADGAFLNVDVFGNIYQLHARGQGPANQWTLWPNPALGDTRGPAMQVKAQLSQTSATGNKYKVSWESAGKTMHLCGNTKKWSWVYVSSTASNLEILQFTFHKFYIIPSKINALFKATWPTSKIAYSLFGVGDNFYEAITSAQAMQIFKDSGLSTYTWKSEIFDCDDFSYVYKAQASKDAYHNKSAEFGYAVGVIFGATTTGNIHAVNVFIDTHGDVKIIEPQSGAIVEGKSWHDAQGAPYAPYFVLI